MRNHPLKIVSTLLVALALAPSVGLAADPGPYQVVTSQDSLESASSALQSTTKNRSTFSKISPISIRLRLRETGWLDLSFNKKRDRFWNIYELGNGAARQVNIADAALLKGTATARQGGGKITHPITAMISKRANSVATTIKFSLPRKTTGKASYYTVKLRDDGKHSLIRVPARALHGKTCGDDTEPAVATGTTFDHTAPAVSISATTYRKLTLTTIADYEYYVALGSNSTTVSENIVSNFNAVEAIYERDFGVTFDLANIYIHTSPADPYDSANAQVLLNEVDSTVNNSAIYGNADLYHLLTGRNIYAVIGSSNEYSVVGLAYIAQVCTLFGSPYSLTEKYNSAVDYIAIAHELGHNFGANHDSTTSPHTIMYPSLPPETIGFSAFSQNEVLNNYLTNHFYNYNSLPVYTTPIPNCLPTVVAGTPTPGPSPTPTSIPTSTPSGGGGGGGGGGGISEPDDSDLPDIEISASLTSSGNTTIDVTLTGETLDSSCTTYLDFTDLVGFRTDRTSSIALGAGDIDTFSLSGTVARRALRPTGKSSAKVYVQARYVCSSEAGTSGRLTLRPDRIKAKGTLSLTKWIRKLSKSLH